MGAIKGIVRDHNHAPLEGLNVLIIGGPTHPDITALTGSDGTFMFSTLKPGNYVIKAFGAAESDDVPVQVVKDKTAFVEIWMDAGAVEDKDNVVDEM